jgi:hypothetical protein
MKVQTIQKASVIAWQFATPNGALVTIPRPSGRNTADDKAVQEFEGAKEGRQYFVYVLENGFSSAAEARRWAFAKDTFRNCAEGIMDGPWAESYDAVCDSESEFWDEVGALMTERAGDDSSVVDYDYDGEEYQYFNAVDNQCRDDVVRGWLQKGYPVLLTVELREKTQRI